MNPIIGSSEATPATAFRSPDINFFTTVLRTDDHSIPRSATVHSLPTDQASYNSEIDMLRITGEMTSDLGRKSTDFSTGIATFTASRASQSLPAALIPGLGRAQVSGDQRLSLSPNAPSSTTDRASVGNASDVATTRGSWSDTSGTSYEDQLLQHFQTVDPPVALFAPMNTEWIYARQALVANARDSSPLLNALYCYADAHKATVEGQRWRWAPTYHKVATSEIQACLHDEMGDSSLINVFGAVLLLMISEVRATQSIDSAGGSLFLACFGS